MAITPPSFVCRADDSPVVTQENWKSWVPNVPPEFANERKDLAMRLRALPATERSAAVRHIFDTWDVKYGREWHDMQEHGEFGLPGLVASWAEKDFEAVFRRVEEWEGYGGNYLRSMLVRNMAAADPVKAGRFMSERLNPMSKQYYYYVLIYGLVPGLKDKPMSVVMPALDASKSGCEWMDLFRWIDATYQLVSGEAPWKSPDLEVDWKYLAAQKPGLLRDLMLGLVLRMRLQQDTAAAITTDIAATGACLSDMHEIFSNGFPKDADLALKLLPDANLQLMDSWVKVLVTPNWHEWANQVLRLPPGSRRDRALGQFTRLWLQDKDEEFTARQWSATLQDQRARTATQREVIVSDLAHRAAETWHAAYEEACAISEPDARMRALLGVFKAGTKEGREEEAARAKAACPDAPDVARLLDAWTLGRYDEVQKTPDSPQRSLEMAQLMLSLHDRCARMELRRGIEHYSRSAGFAAAAELIRKSHLNAEEKHRIRQELAVSQIDATMDGTQAGEGPGGFRGALNATVDIEDSHVRFIQQRSVVHAAVRRDPEEARFDVQNAKLDPETRARLMKEWERVSRWAGARR
ncbi:hypothetical protein AYO49_03460 [Verrucomicrobiaceae bacterium SCGC AG-212-N21]|nr:hypothetical protein AYO49_03460 [Verrucomicrobiaceae bacterium SCGC AG-212-N21]